MWLPKPIYELVPYLCIGLGTAGIWAAFYLESWYWAEITAIDGLIALVIGLMLLLRRRGYRSSRSRLDFDRSE